METDREFSFVGLLSLAQLISWGALYYSFAIVSVPIERDLGWDKATVNGAWSIGLLFTGLAAFPVGIFLDRLGGRIIMTGGTLLGVACLLLWSNTEHLSTLYVVCIGLGIAMSGSLYEAGFAVLTWRGYGPVVWGLFALAVIGAVSYGVATYAAEGGKP